jgi:hypothetical protein
LLADFELDHYAAFGQSSSCSSRWGMIGFASERFRAAWPTGRFLSELLVDDLQTLAKSPQ